MIKNCKLCGNEFNALDRTKTCSKECRKEVRLNDARIWKSKPESKLKMKLSKDIYRKQPENIEREKLYAKKPEAMQKQREYRARPETKQKALERGRTPEEKQKKKAYRDRPDIKLKQKLYTQSYRKVPKNKARKQELMNTPEYIEVSKKNKARPEVKQKNKERKQTPEYIAYAKEYRVRPTVKVQDRLRLIEYYKDPIKKEMRNMIKHRRRARETNAGGSHTVTDWLNLKILLGNHCLGCWKTNLKLEQDHIIPIARGGTDHMDNIQPLCRNCNGTKHAKYPVPNLIEVCIG
jgi:5-methylcytosine-specific restriction endonuclease McrA